MSKRKLCHLIQEGFIENWNDPRIPTLNGLRRKGYTPKSIQDFCFRIGISKRDNVIDFTLLEFSIREQLNKIATRVMVVLNPIKLVIENYHSDKTEWFYFENYHSDKKEGKRKISFSKILYLEREDFIEIAPINFHRLSIGKEVRLKNAYIIKVTGFLKDYNGNIIEISAVYDYKSKSSKRKIKSTLHWVDTSTAIAIETRFYELLFYLKAKKQKINILNPQSLKIVHGYGEPFLKQIKIGEIFQFQRIGYFCVDKTICSLIFNRTVNINRSYL